MASITVTRKSTKMLNAFTFTSITEWSLHSMTIIWMLLLLLCFKIVILDRCLLFTLNTKLKLIHFTGGSSLYISKSAVRLSRPRRAIGIYWANFCMLQK